MDQIINPEEFVVRSFLLRSLLHFSNSGNEVELRPKQFLFFALYLGWGTRSAKSF